MSRHCIFPGIEHLIVIVLFSTDASLVLDFSQFGGTLFIHAILEVAAHSAISLTDLAEDVSLVGLLLVGDLKLVLFVSSVLSFDLGINLVLVVLLEPLGLLLQGLLKKYVLLTVLVDVLEEVDTSLILTTPLLFTSVPLVLVLLLSQLVNHALILRLI